MLRAETAPTAVSVSGFAMQDATPSVDRRRNDAEALAWVEALSGGGRRHDDAVAALLATDSETPGA